MVGLISHCAICVQCGKYLLSHAQSHCHDTFGGYTVCAIPSDEEDRNKQLRKLNKIVRNYVKSYIKHDSDCSNIIDLLLTKINRLFAGKKFIKKWEKLINQFCLKEECLQL